MSGRKGKPYPNNIKECIRFYGYKVGEVAISINLPRSTLSDYLVGNRPAPRACLQKIADFIGCDVKEFTYQRVAVLPPAAPASLPAQRPQDENEDTGTASSLQQAHLVQVAPRIEPAQTPIHMVISAAQKSLLDDEQDVVSQEQEMPYDSLEIDVVATALKWRFWPETISTFQRRIQTKIKEYDIMKCHDSGDAPRVSRRHALQAIAKFPIQVYGLTIFGFKDNHLPPVEEILPLCAAGLTASRALAQQGDIATIAQTLARYLPTLETLAQQTSPHQQAAAHLAAQSYLLATIVADHYRKLDYMEAYSREARRYGQLAQDPDLEVSALARLAVKFDYEGRDHKALETYQEAFALTSLPRVSPLLQGRLYAGLAGTYAYCEQREEALRFLGLARDIYPEHPEEDPCFHFAYSGNTTLYLWEGLTRKHLGQYTEAWNAFTQVGTLQPQPGLSETNRAESLNYVASVAVRQRELDISCFYLEAAEEVAWTVGHEQRYAEVLDTFKSLKTLWPDEPGVKKLRKKMNERSVS